MLMLQAAGDAQGLIQELASDYDGYHASLAATLEQLGTEPDPNDFRDDFEGYSVACAKVMEVFYAEVFLRQSVDHVQTGRPFSVPERQPVPLIDDRQRLVSRRTGKAAPDLNGTAPREQVACPFPVS